jgi:lysophospholipase L1-like esterase
MVRLLLFLVLASPGMAHAEGTPRLVVALGDSTTAGTPGFLSPAEAPPEGRGDPRSQYGYWLEKARPGWRVLNRGVNGERADEVRARFARDVEGARPEAVIILAGVNDAYQGRDLAETQADLRWMWRRAKELRLRAVAATVLPFSHATPEQSARIEALNAWLPRAAKAEGAKVCDTAAAAADPKDSRKLKGTPDGLHPDVATYRAVGEALARCLR